ncbi:MAG: hypothetical protein ABW104_18865 [Candidatus Thiodiazotropha sp. 6PLUC2]
MAQIFDMKRLHHGCGESLQCNLLDLLIMNKTGSQESLQEQRNGSQKQKLNRVDQKPMRFWG